MQRNLDQLEHDQFDLLVIGAGIYGISVARDAVLRGLKVCLIDANDFGSGTSHNSLKIIHGGIRYFQHLNLKRVFESVQERERWVQISNKLIKPLKFILPAYGYGSRGPLALGAAINMHNLVAAMQNKKRAYPNGYLISKADYQQLLPEINGENIKGGAVWYDGQIVDADRLHIELLKDAHRQGLCLANYLRADELLIASKKSIGVHVKDMVTGRHFDIKASQIINAAGPWAYRLLKSSIGTDEYNFQPLTKNFNIVIDSIRKDFAFGVKSNRASDAVIGESKRVYFFTPWLNKTVIGTAHFEHDISKEMDTDVSSELPGFMDEINEAYPSINLSQDKVNYIYSGFTPAEQSSANDRSSRSHRTNIIDHARVDNIDNLISVIGVKYTTARSTASRVVDMVVDRINYKAKKIPISNYSLQEYKSIFSNIDDLCLQPIISQDKINTIYLKNMYKHISYTIEAEMVFNLEDYVLRRNNLAKRGYLGRQNLEKIAKEMANKFNWSDNQMKVQLENISKKLHIVS